MRTKIKLAGFVGLLTILGIAACSDNEPENAPLSESAKQYLSMRLGSGRASADGMSGAINQSFEGLFNMSGASNGRLSGDSTSTPGEPGDTTIIDDPYPWTSCAVVTETDNEDGSHTTIQDYGEGCEEGWGDYTYFMHGKLTNTYHNLFSQIGSVFKDSYFYSTAYDNYGGNYNGEWAWLMNGGGTYEGESEYDTANQTFSGSYSYEDETTYQYDSTTYSYKGNGTTRYDETKYVVESNESEYSTGVDNFYKSKVLTPLVSDYACYSFAGANRGIDDSSFAIWFTYVSGRERIEFKEGELEGTFEIDYGNGACDNIITVYENGNKTVVDLSKNWNL